MDFLNIGGQHMPDFFNYRFTDEQLRRDFERFIENNVQSIFSDTRAMTKNYTISYVQAKSVVNMGGKIRDTLQDVANEITVPSSNNSAFAPIHIASTLTTIHGMSNGSFQKLINNLRSLMRVLEQENYRYNVVWYSNYFDIATTM